MKYKIGDKVKIREDIETWDKYGHESVTPAMAKFAGKFVTISERYDTFKVYNINDDGGIWAWTDEMFEDAQKFKVGDIVVKVSDGKHRTLRKGWAGTVTEVDTNSPMMRMRDEYGTVYSDRKEDFMVCTPDKLVITTKGKRVTAKLYYNERLISQKEASCHPDDEFDFRQGVKLVIDRLGLGVGDDIKPIDLLEDGLFAYDNKRGWSIVLNNNLVYADGNFAPIDRFDDNLVDTANKERRIECIVRAKSFNLAKNKEDVVWEVKK